MGLRIEAVIRMMMVTMAVGAGVCGVGCVVRLPADLLLVGGVIYTMDRRHPMVEAVAVRGGRIVFTGDRGEAAMFRGPDTRVIELDKEMVVPGLVDAHGHVMNLGSYLAELRLIGTSSAAEVRRMVLEKQSKADEGAWIMGRGWDQNDWETKSFPTWRDLDGTEANPVYLRRVDGHAAWVNKTALDFFGITRDTADPPGGRIVRDERGDPTGVLIDRAKDLAFEEIPEPPLVEKTRRIRLAIEECKRFGLTGVHDAGAKRDEVEIYRRLEEAGELGFRIYVMMDADDSTFVREEFERGPSVGNYVTVRALKLYADGALGSRGAALLEPYSDEPEQRGLQITAPRELANWTRLALQKGFQVCTHAIGDAGNRSVIDVYERETQSFPGLDHRFRVEHAQVLALEDIDRMAESKIIASMQPTHATSDMYWATDRLGTRRVEGAYAWRKLVDAGVLIACGSDFPVESVNPLWGIYAAVTRRDHDGWPPGGWRAGECLTLDEALKGFTIHAAYAGFAERKSGTIEVGKLADLTVFDRDISHIAPEEILDRRVVHTIVGGEVVFSASSHQGDEKEVRR